jgi:hypothetical protein
MTNNITAKVNLSGTIITQSPVTVKNTPTLVSGSSFKLEGLSNIDSTHEETGSTLIYDSTTGKWVAQPLNVDGGSF